MAPVQRFTAGSKPALPRTVISPRSICLSSATTGPYESQGDGAISGLITSLLYQSPAMRFRALSVLTNTPPRVSQSQPGGMQGITVIDPVLAKAARQLGVDQVTIRRLNSPAGKAIAGPPGPGGTGGLSSSGAFVHEALDKGAALFQWNERQAQSKRRVGTKVRGVGIGMSTFFAGSNGFDGLLVIKPDGRLYAQSGIGNFGTESVMDVHRVAAEIIGIPWEKVEIVQGNTGKHLPWTCISGGSQTTHAMTRAAHAAANDAKRKLQEIAAKTLGGTPEQYQVAGERVFSGGRSMTLAQAARKAIELGGKYDGHEVAEDLNAFTKQSAAALAGGGLMGVARDSYKGAGQPFSFVVGFAEVEVDVETGQYPPARLPRRRRCRHRASPAQSGRPDSRPLDVGHRARHRPEVGLRSALRRRRWPSASTRTSRRRCSTRRSTCAGPLSRFPIRAPRSAPKASVNRRWPPDARRS